MADPLSVITLFLGGKEDTNDGKIACNEENLMPLAPKVPTNVLQNSATRRQFSARFSLVENAARNSCRQPFLTFYNYQLSYKTFWTRK